MQDSTLALGLPRRVKELQEKLYQVILFSFELLVQSLGINTICTASLKIASNIDIFRASRSSYFTRCEITSFQLN